MQIRGTLIETRRFFFAAVVLIAAIFAIPCTARSQAALLVLLFGEEVASENFYFSLKLCGNLANLSGFGHTKNALGLHFGVMASFKLGDRFYLVPELMPLSQKGAEGIPFRPTGNPFPIQNQEDVWSAS